jgi:hypothetical protein
MFKLTRFKEHTTGFSFSLKKFDILIVHSPANLTTVFVGEEISFLNFVRNSNDCAGF